MEPDVSRKIFNKKLRISRSELSSSECLPNNQLLSLARKIFPRAGCASAAIILNRFAKAGGRFGP
jgi:hypothetical protein